METLNQVLKVLFEETRSEDVIDAYLDKEAIRVISSMPKWTPGVQNGKKVRVKYTVPVSFRLQ